ncbi:MAG TPA: anti-sigma factor RsbA family regulatory protein [Pseudonocardiaceae bacterium]
MPTLDAPAAGAFVHPALFYRGAEEYLEGTVQFIRAGLDAGEPVAVAVPGPNLRLILSELGADAKRVRALDMTQVGRNPGRIIPGVLSAFADAHRGKRAWIIGEPIWAGRTATEYPACVQHEALINLAFADRAVSILCPYDVERLSPQVLADAEATHPVLTDACGTRTSAAYAPERIVAHYNQPLPAPEAPSITFTSTSLAQARLFAVEQAIGHGLDGDHTELELIVGELVANSVAHGGGGGTLAVWAEDGNLVCEVRDGGHVTDPLAGRRPVDRNQAGGRGLLLVNHLCDLVRMYTCPAGTTVRLHLALPAQAHAEPGGVDRRTRPVPDAHGGHRPSLHRVPLRRQTQDALRAAARFTRYLPPEATEQPEYSVDRRHLRPVLEALVAADVLAQVVELWRSRLVKLARHRGARWTEIGRALGVSKQAAHERYGRSTRRTAADREVSPLDVVDRISSPLEDRLGAATTPGARSAPDGGCGTGPAAGTSG